MPPTNRPKQGPNSAGIVERAAQGDHAAFSELVERYKGAVYALAFGRLGRSEDARDVAQNVFVSVYLNLNRLRNTAQFSAWLRRITTNACCAHLRRTRKVDSLDRMNIVQTDQIDRLLNDLAVRQALSCLTPQTRLTLSLYYFHGYSTSEIAAFLDLPVTAVKSRLRDGRARLKKEMWHDLEEKVKLAAPGYGFQESVARLIGAAIEGDTITVRDLLALDPTLVAETGEVDEDSREFMYSQDAGDGWTPLHLAAHYGHLDIVKLLLECGADIEAVSQNAIRNTPISAAAWGNQLDVMEYLITAGAKIDAPNSWGATALHRAVDANRYPLAELLLAHGADPHRPKADGKTPLALARETGQAEMAATLAQYGEAEKRLAEAT